MPFWWSVVVMTALAFGLVGCDSPSPAFQGLPARQFTVDGSVFSIRANRHEAEAMRINMELRARGPVIVAKGARAMEIATGCTVKQRTLKGDTNIVRADLSCPKTPPRRERSRSDLNLDCDLVAPVREGAFGTETAQVDCDVVSRSR